MSSVDSSPETRFQIHQPCVNETSEKIAKNRNSREIHNNAPDNYKNTLKYHKFEKTKRENKTRKRSLLVVQATWHSNFDAKFWPNKRSRVH